MFIVLIPRVGISHILSYILSTGHYRTLCGKIITKNNVTNTIAVDNACPGVCDNCYQEMRDIYLDDLNFDPRLARNSWQVMLESIRVYHYQEISGPVIMRRIMMKRFYHKLSKAKKILFRNKQK